jgi:hypothetical protein
VVFGDASAPADTTPPVITPTVTGTPGDNDWYVGDVTVSWVVGDPESPVTAQTGCDITTLTTDTTGITLTCEATSAGGTSSQSVTLKRDATPPVLAPGVSPNPVLLNGSATASPNASDPTSGLAIEGCDPVDTSAVGDHTVGCTATDLAGNTASASANYTVIFNFEGLSSPLAGSSEPQIAAASAPALHVAKAGSTIPLRWRLTDANGMPVTSLTSARVTAVSLTCPLGTTGDLLEESDAGGSGLQNLGDGTYQFNWKTPKSYAESCKTMKLDLGEGAGQEHRAAFQFTK